MSGRARCVFAAVAVLLLAACSGMFEGKRIEYKSANKLPPLEVPPDLTNPARDDRYQVPDNAAKGPSTYSEYSKERAAGQPAASSSAVLPTADKAHLERSGAQRWLVVSEPPEKVWPMVKDFWQEQNFLIKTEMPDVGVMETDWNENRAKIPQDGLRYLLGGLVDGMYSTSERDKFRTRLERGAQPGTTEVYISHRGVVEVYSSQRQDTTVWQPRPSDPELEAEFLQRLLLRFGVQEAKAQAEIKAPVIDHAKLVKTENGVNALELAEPFDRAWRRVGLALDRVGFTVEDRDRSQGYYFVRFVDPEKDATDTTKQGFFSRLIFGKDKSPGTAAQYRVLVKDQKESSEVQVLDKDGGVESSETGKKILALLHEQLK
jgi:outer membrane protein assembly factor BamC